MSIRRTAQRAALRSLAKQVVDRNTTFAHMPPSQEETEGLSAAWEKARRDEVRAAINADWGMSPAHEEAMHRITRRQD